MSTHSAPWRQPQPKSNPPIKLTPASMAQARAAARRAGRRYPNLVDNMNAARRQREAEQEQPSAPSRGGTSAPKSATPRKRVSRRPA